MILLGEARGVSVIHRDSIEGRATPLRVLPRVSRHTVWVAYYGCEHTDRAGVRQGVRTVSLYGSYSTTGNIFHTPPTPRALRAPVGQTTDENREIMAARRPPLGRVLGLASGLPRPRLPRSAPAERRLLVRWLKALTASLAVWQTRVQPPERQHLPAGPALCS